MDKETVAPHHTRAAGEMSMTSSACTVPHTAHNGTVAHQYCLTLLEQHTKIIQSIFY